MKKVLIIIERISIGGTGSSLKNLLSIADNPEYDITVGLLSDYKVSSEKLNGIVKTVDLGVLNRPQISKLRKAAVLLFWKYGLKFYYHRIKSLIEKKRTKSGIIAGQLVDMRLASIVPQIDLSENYDIVVSWCEKYTNYLLANNIIARNKIGFVHPDYLAANFQPNLDELYFKNLDYICAVSKTGLNSLITAFPHMQDRFDYVYNKLPIIRINTLSQEKIKPYNKDTLNIVTVGRLQNSSKGYDRIIRVAKVLIAQGYRFTWRIVGDGEDKREIEKMIYHYQLSESIILLGEKDNPYPYIKQADLFALCSYYEGFPVVVDEAFALSVPCFVTDYSAAKEQVPVEYGYIVQNNDESIINGLTDILKHRELLDSYRLNLEKRPIDRYSDCSDFYRLLGKCEK